MTKSNFKQIAFTIMLAIIATFASTNVSEAVDCWHTYSAATCTRAKKCTKCGATLGYPLGHNYVVCGNTAKCTECGASKIIESVSGLLCPKINVFPIIFFSPYFLNSCKYIIIFYCFYLFITC